MPYFCTPIHLPRGKYFSNLNCLANVGYTRHGFSETYVDQFFEFLKDLHAVKFYLAENTQTDCVTKNCLFG